MIAHEQFSLESSPPVMKCHPRDHDRAQGSEDYDADGDVLLHGAVLFWLLGLCFGFVG